MQRFTQDPDATLDYRFDWSAWLIDDDTIADAVVTVEGADDDLGDLAIFDQSFTTTTVTVWVTGVTAGHNYKVTCHVTTTQGREDERSARIVGTNR